jgi:Protein of unknown function (DUF2721)
MADGVGRGAAHALYQLLRLRRLTERATNVMVGTVEIIHTLVAPVVMISAQGLICLALYNRLAAVVGRLRVFSRENFDAQTRLDDLSPEQQEGALARRLRARMAALNGQYSGVLRRARLLRKALILLQTAVLAMLICTMVLGLSLALPGVEGWSLVPFFAGVLATAGAIVLSIRELAVALDPVRAERAALRKERADFISHLDKKG